MPISIDAYRTARLSSVDEDNKEENIEFEDRDAINKIDSSVSGFLDNMEEVDADEEAAMFDFSAFRHEVLKVEVVKLKDAAKLLGVSLQTIYNRITDGRDQELIDNLVIYEYYSDFSKKHKRRYFIKADFIKRRMKEIRPSLREIREDISTIYYKIYELLEGKVYHFKKKKDNPNLFANMKDIDRLIARYVISRAEDILGEKLTARKEAMVRFAISSLYFSGYAEATFVKKAMILYLQEIREGKYSEFNT